MLFRLYTLLNKQGYGQKICDNLYNSDQSTFINNVQNYVYSEVYSIKYSLLVESAKNAHKNCSYSDKDWSDYNSISNICLCNSIVILIFVNYINKNNYERKH